MGNMRIAVQTKHNRGNMSLAISYSDQGFAGTLKTVKDYDSNSKLWEPPEEHGYEGDTAEDIVIQALETIRDNRYIILLIDSDPHTWGSVTNDGLIS